MQYKHIDSGTGHGIESSDMVRGRPPIASIPVIEGAPDPADSHGIHVNGSPVEQEDAFSRR